MNDKTEHAFKIGTEILKELDIPFFLTGGTFLGIKRDGHLIDWDNDIDTDILAEDLTPDKLQKLSSYNGYFCGSPDTLQPPHVCMFIDGIRFDFFTLHLRNQKRFRNISGTTCQWFPEKFYNPPFEFIEYNGIKYRVPSHQEEWLNFFYTENWKKPDKSWKWEFNARNICDIKEI